MKLQLGRKELVRSIVEETVHDILNKDLDEETINEIITSIWQSKEWENLIVLVKEKAEAN